MIYRPPKSNMTMWDTWLFAEQGEFYLFTLTAEHSRQGYDSISLARSEDLVHWEDCGVIWRKPPEADSMGTGHTWKVGDTYVLNYSEFKDHLQKIRFATSKDLLHWTDLGDEYESRPDDRWYQVGHEGSSVVEPRWDTINVVPAEAGTGYIGYLTATANFGPLARRGVIGCVRSEDGMHFTAAPPVSEPGISCQMEIGGPAKIGAHWYMAACLPQGFLGERFELRDNGLGTQYLIAESQDGPFRLPPGNNRLLSASQRWHYYGRFFSHEKTVFFHHHSCPTLAASGAYEVPGESVSFAPVKEVREISPGQIALYYWKGNNSLYGQRVAISEDGFHPIFSGKATSTSWEFTGDTIVGQANSTGAITYHELGKQMQCGIIVDVIITLQTDSKVAGLFLGYPVRTAPPFVHHMGCAMIIHRDGTVEIGGAVHGYGGMNWCFALVDRQTDCVEAGASHRVKVLARSSFVELYVDERLVQAISMSERFQGVGLLVEAGTAAFSELTMHRMTLPSIRIGEAK